MKIHKYLISVLLLAFIISLFPPGLEANAEGEPVRIINVIYDDSRSMIENDDEVKVDTWCQAKYAMEVFASMMGQNDTMNVYVMSMFSSKIDNAGPRVTLKGSDSQSANVGKIHEMLTEAGNTPFNSVRKAYADLAAVKADEKWLLVLTDGEFQGVSDVDAFFAQKTQDINVMFLGMGPEAEEIKAKPDNGIYFEKAATSGDILDKLTGICMRIFNSNRLNVNTSAKTVNFDIPMGELVIFAQGANVTIDKIVGADGHEYLPSTAPVNVKYSEKAATNYDGAIVSKELMGYIATFKDDFPAGSYTLGVSGANTIEVYYKPNVEIAIFLTDENDNEVAEIENLRAGSYTIEFGFVKAGTNERIAPSELLGDVSYSASVQNNGEADEHKYTNGDTLAIDEGSFVMDTTAYYLDFHSVSTHREYTVYKDKEITFEVSGADAECDVTAQGVTNTPSITLVASIEGEAPTDEQWAEMTVPKVTFDEQAPFTDYRIEKSDKAGTYILTPISEPNELNSESYQKCGYRVYYEGRSGEAVWVGSMDGIIKLNDSRSWFERNARTIFRLAGLGTLLLLILGYIPPFKKYLPKRMKAKPAIDCSPRVFGIIPSSGKGRFEKDMLSTLIPYMAQKGSLKVTPAGVFGAPKLELKAHSSGSFLITNVSKLAGRENITFDGVSVPAGTVKPLRKGAGTMISVTTPEMTYTCVPSID